MYKTSKSFQNTKIYTSAHRTSRLIPNQFHEQVLIHPDRLSRKKGASFDKLKLLKEITMNAGYQYVENAPFDIWQLIIPIVGSVSIFEENSKMIGVGQIYSGYFMEGDEISFKNPYENQIVHFLQIGLQISMTHSHGETISFDLDDQKNVLQKIIYPHNEFQPLQLSMGKFDGRSDYKYYLTTGDHAFVYVPEGAFEIEHCLLERSEGLGIRDSRSIDCEALSNDAILLILEF